jgi:uncharacterized protein
MALSRQWVGALIGSAQRVLLGLMAGLIASVFLVLATAPQWVRAQSIEAIPELKTQLTDLTGTLNQQEVAQLTSQLAAIEQSKGAQVAILIVPTTAPEDIFDYSIRVVEKWKLGRGKVDGKMVADGVLILVAKNDKKIRIEVGRGLEGVITDGRAKRIIAESISPRFKTGDFAGGLQAGVDDLGKLIAGETLPEPWKAPTKGTLPAPSSDEGGGLADLLPLLLIAFVGSVIARAVLGRFLGSIASGVGTGFLINLFTGFLPVAIGAGILAFLVMMMTGGGRRTSGRVGPRTFGHGPVILPGGWGSGGGGGFSGGGGGGFSGGGGDFGGGGASGDW